MSYQTQPSPLLVVGIDAGDPVLLRRWAKEGHLPVLASLMKRGSWAQTCGPELMLEHGAWVSIFSGISRGRHGFHYFRQLKPRSYDLELIHGPEINATPFWASSPNQHRRVVVADVPDGALYGAVPGLQLVNWAVHRGFNSRAPADQPRSVPPRFLDEVIQTFGPAVQLAEAPGADAAGNRRIHRKLVARVEKKGALCCHMIERSEPDLVVCCFGESHTAGHQFWRYCGTSAPPPPNGNEFAHATRDVYAAIDRQLGRLLELLPPSTNVVVLSSIGLADYYPTTGLLDSFCLGLGYQAGAKKSSTSFGPVALARRALPEKWRISLSRYLSRESRERILAQQFQRSADWKQTTAFAIPSFYTGFLRVNLRGREPEGIVEPGAEYEAVLQNLENDLGQLIDPQTGQPAIEKVVRAGDVYGCNPPEVLPDLIVHWKSCSHFVDRVIHPKVVLTQKKPEFFRDSDHSHKGFFAAAGPAIQNLGELPDVEVLDLAPTLLALLDEAKSEQMTGDIIKDLLQPQPSILVS